MTPAGVVETLSSREGTKERMEERQLMTQVQNHVTRPKIQNLYSYASLMFTSLPIRIFHAEAAE